ncbi:DUF4279 domain-containing protein [Planobispora takensis]|uniref:DUF4279 domain-containing protein n=1 Tax=Planobispora takensis TaxID=1367882 RepID=UPI001941BA02|nr:DUF4279 domain-containing protein [Planobispora takensis]
MRIRQYVYLAVKSEIMDAEDMAARIGLDPDETMVRGARSTNPPRPAAHAWKIGCRAPGLPVDEMISLLRAPAPA